MRQEKQYIAVDLGAESGRVMLGLVSEDKLGGLSEEKGAQQILDRVARDW